MILVLLGVLIGLVMAELAARLLEPPYEQTGGYYECDRMVGWRGRPGDSRITKTEGLSLKVIWNSRGMHDKEHRIEKEEGVFRILMLGDSFVEAVQVEESQSSHHILEETLNSLASPNIKLEVISAGIGGWGPAQELIYFRTEGRAYTPDLVLALWVPANDLGDILPDGRLTFGGINCYAPYFAICNGQFDPEPWFSAPGVPPTWKECSASKKILTNVLNHLYFSSHLYQRLEPALVQGYHKIEYSHPYAPWLENRSDEALDYSYHLTAGIYSHLADEASQIGAKTALVIVPPKQAVYSEVDPGFRKMMQQELQKAGDMDAINPTLPNQVFTELMETRGLPVLDLHPHFVTHLEDGGEPPYWETDSHWNVTGNRLVAEVIANWVIDQELVPISNPKSQLRYNLQ